MVGTWMQRISGTGRDRLEKAADTTLDGGEKAIFAADHGNHALVADPIDKELCCGHSSIAQPTWACHAAAPYSPSRR